MGENTLRDQELRLGLSKVRKLELCTLLKTLGEGASEQEKDIIRNTVTDSQLSIGIDHLALNVEDRSGSIKKIVEYLKRENTRDTEKELVFTFDCRCIATEQFLEEISCQEGDISDYTLTLGHKTLVYVAKTWYEGNTELRKLNMGFKYVKKSEKLKEKIIYSLSQTYIPSTISEQRRILSYLDANKTIVNWEAVVVNLKSLAVSSGYSPEDIKQSLLSCVRLTNLNESLYEDLTEDEIAQELIRSVRPIDKMAVLWSSLRNLERPPDQPLQQILATADGLISKIFPKPGERRQKTNLEIQALCSFTSDQLSKEIADDIKVRREAGQEVNFNYYRQHALRLESMGNCPTTALKFGRNHRNSADNRVELWNSQDSAPRQYSTLNSVVTRPSDTAKGSLEEEEEYLDMIRHRRGLEKNRKLGIGGRLTLDVSDIPSMTETSSSEDETIDLGTIFADRGEGPFMTVYIKRPPRGYFKCNLSECDEVFQIHLLKSMLAGRATQELNLSWNDDKVEVRKIKEEDYLLAKKQGVKPVKNWTERQIETLRSKLDVINMITPVTLVQHQQVTNPETAQPDNSDEDEGKVYQLNSIGLNKEKEGGYPNKDRYTPGKFSGTNSTRMQQNPNWSHRDGSADRVKDRYQNQLLNKDKTKDDHRNTGASATPNYNKERQSRKDIYDNNRVENRERKDSVNQGSREPYASRTSRERIENGARPKDTDKNYQELRRRNSTGDTTQYINNSPRQYTPNNRNNGGMNQAEGRTPNRTPERTKRWQSPGQEGYKGNEQRYQSRDRMPTMDRPNTRNNSNNYGKDRGREGNEVYCRSNQPNERDYRNNDKVRYSEETYKPIYQGNYNGGYGRARSREKSWDRNPSLGWSDRDRKPRTPDNYDRNRTLLNRSDRENRFNTPTEYDRDQRYSPQGRGNYNNNRSSGRNYSSERQRNDGYRNRSQENGRTTVHEDLKPGWNCAPNYRPDLYKMCRKCSALGVFTHHEYLCKKYLRFNKSLCTSCTAGFHLEKDCDTIRVSNNFTQEVQQVTEEVKVDRIKELIDLLDRQKN